MQALNKEPQKQGKRVAILQSNYIPWKGYFDLINSVDEFVLYDDMQYTKRDWRNRNKIKTCNGLRWLTVPVETKGKYYQKICETMIANYIWSKQHWDSIVHSYAKTPCFPQFRNLFEELYLGTTEKYLSQLNFRFIKAICEIFNITTNITWSMDYRLVEGKNERIIDLCKQAGATEYISGPSARDYLEPAQFQESGIKLKFMDYSGYKEYQQLYPPFEHGVSILDLIFNEGYEVKKFMRSF